MEMQEMWMQFFYQDITGGISEVLEMNKDGECLMKSTMWNMAIFRVRNATIQVQKYKK